MIGSFDSDPVHVRTHSQNFPKSKSVVADIRSLDGPRVRELLSLADDDVIDVMIGGPPCQGFSMIGKREMSDPRNLLIREFCRLISELQPKYFVMENVSGLLYGPARRFLAEFLKEIRMQGYRWVSPIKILNAADYGVPQYRNRVIVLGYRADQEKPNYPQPRKKRITVLQAIGDLNRLGRYRTLLRSDVFNGKLGKASPYARELRSNDALLTGCFRSEHTPEVLRRFRSTKQGATEPVSHFPRLHLKRPAPTLRAGTSKQNGSFTAARPIHPTQARCITVREAARLHSFPDWFVFDTTRWHGFRQIGNAVPPKLAGAIAASLRRTLIQS